MRESSLFLLFLLLPLLYSGFNKKPTITNVKVYHKVGGTCGSHYKFMRVFRHLDSVQAPFQTFSTAQLHSLEKIIQNSKRKRLFPAKICGRVFFCRLRFSNKKFDSRIAVLRRHETSGFIIIDFVFKKEYHVKDSLDIAWLENIYISINPKDTIHNFYDL